MYHLRALACLIATLGLLLVACDDNSTPSSYEQGLSGSLPDGGGYDDDDDTDTDGDTDGDSDSDSDCDGDTDSDTEDDDTDTDGDTEDDLDGDTDGDTDSDSDTDEACSPAPEGGTETDALPPLVD